MENFYKFRVAFDEDDGYGWVFSPQSYLEFRVPPMPEILNEKVSLLKLVDKGGVDGIGKRKLKNVFYVIFNENEYQQLCKQVHASEENKNV